MICFERQKAKGAGFRIVSIHQVLPGRYMC